MRGSLVNRDLRVAQLLKTSNLGNDPQTVLQFAPVKPRASASPDVSGRGQAMSSADPTIRRSTDKHHFAEKASLDQKLANLDAFLFFAERAPERGRTRE